MKSGKRIRWSSRELVLAQQLTEADVCYSCIAKILNARFHDRTEVRTRHSVRGIIYYYDANPPRRRPHGNGVQNFIDNPPPNHRLSPADPVVLGESNNPNQGR